MKTFLTFILASLYIALPAQTYNTKPGFLVTLAGDTLRGLVRDRNDFAEQLLFKTETAPDFMTYTPHDIAAFAVEDQYFYEGKSIAPGQKIFLLVLAKGTLNLYQHPAESIFYLQKQDGTLHQLEKQDVLVGSTYRTDLRYQRMLRALTADCPDVQRTVERANFNNRDLQRAVEAYNQCIEPTTAATPVFRKSVQLQVQKGLKARLYHGNLEFVADDGYYTSGTFSPTTHFSGGIFFKLFYNEKYAVQPELLFTRKATVIKLKTIFGQNDSEDYVFDFLQLPVSFYYTFPTSKIKPFLLAGGAYSYALKGTFTRTRDGERQPSRDLFTGANDNNLNRSEWAFRGGAGVQWQLREKLGIQLEYLYEQTFANGVSIHFAGHSVKAGILF